GIGAGLKLGRRIFSETQTETTSPRIGRGCQLTGLGEQGVVELAAKEGLQRRIGQQRGDGQQHGPSGGNAQVEAMLKQHHSAPTPRTYPIPRRVRINARAPASASRLRKTEIADSTALLNTSTSSA